MVSLTSKTLPIFFIHYAGHFFHAGRANVCNTNLYLAHKMHKLHVFMFFFQHSFDKSIKLFYDFYRPISLQRELEIQAMLNFSSKLPAVRRRDSQSSLFTPNFSIAALRIAWLPIEIERERNCSWMNFAICRAVHGYFYYYLLTTSRPRSKMENILLV